MSSQDDARAIGALLAELYAVISGPPGERDWDRFRALFAPAARLLPSRRTERGVVLEVLDPDGYAASRGPIFRQSAFYARFADKEALLGHLEQLLFETTRTVVARIAAHAAGRAPASLLRELTTALVRIYRRQRAVARALVLRSHTDPALAERLRALNRDNMRRIADALLASGAIRHPQPERAIWFALHAQRALLRDAILFGDGWAGERRISDARLVDEAARLVAGYLGLAECG